MGKQAMGNIAYNQVSDSFYSFPGSSYKFINIYCKMIYHHKCKADTLVCNMPPRAARGQTKKASFL